VRGAGTDGKMSIEIEIATGASSRAAAAPLLSAVWPPEALKALPWGHITFADPDLRVMIDRDGETVCHVGITRRAGTWNGRKVHIGGLGNVATRADCRGRGYATLAINAAIHTLTEEHSIDFGMLFCEPHNSAFYEKLGWQSFNGPVYAEQAGQRTSFTAMAPYVFRIRRLLREGTIDLCGLPW
jgi:predicted acetyltransferase